MDFTVSFAYAYLILIIGVAFVVTFFAYRKSNFSKPFNRILPLLRWCGLVLLGVLLLNPIVSTTTVEAERPVLAWLQDHSRSILAQQDSSNFSQQYFTWLKDTQRSLENKYQVIPYEFDRELNPLQFNFDGTKSAIGDAILETNRRLDGRNVAGIVLVSDGIVNVGSPLSMAENSIHPIYILALGDSSYYPDINIVNVVNNSVGYKGNTTLLEANIHVSALSINTLDVFLKHRGQELEHKRISVNRNTAKAVFEIPLDSLGIQVFEIEVLSDPGERNVENNKKYIQIEVLENKKSIAIVYDSPHPDIAALRLPFASDPTMEIQLFQKEVWIPSATAKSDLILFHRCVPSKEDWSKLKVSGQAVALVTDQKHNYFHWRDLDDFFDNMPLLERGAEFQLTPRDGFAGYPRDRVWEDALIAYPPIVGEMHSESQSGNWNPSFLGSIGSVKTETPVFSIASNGAQRFGWLNGEGWWKLRAYTYQEFSSAEKFDNEIRNWVRWLTTLPGEEQLQVEHPIVVNKGESFEMVARVKDESLQWVNDAVVSISIHKNTGEDVESTFTLHSNGEYILPVSSWDAGDYAFQVEAKVGSQLLKKRGEFSVQNVDFELLDTRARFSELRRVSQTSQGEFFTLLEKDELVTQLMELNAPSLMHETIQKETLLKKEWLLIIALLLFVAEWALRKREGAV